MGSPSGESHRFPDETAHQVTLTKAFYCGKFEVTQRQWQTVCVNNPSYFEDAGPDAPVESVSWDDCQAFVKRLCRMEGVPEGTCRLLTEAEWEYACRAGTRTPFCHESGLDLSMANFRSNRTTCVDGFRSNAWGLYDMHGNVWEWCHDWYGACPSGAVTDPLGPHSGGHRVNRGGSWDDYAGICRSADRFWNSPCFRNNNLGLRLARIIIAVI